MKRNSICDSSKAEGYKINIQKSIPFSYIIDKQMEFEI